MYAVLKYICFVRTNLTSIFRPRRTYVLISYSWQIDQEKLPNFQACLLLWHDFHLFPHPDSFHLFLQFFWFSSYFFTASCFLHPQTPRYIEIRRVKKLGQKKTFSWTSHSMLLPDNNHTKRSFSQYFLSSIEILFKI